MTRINTKIINTRINTKIIFALFGVGLAFVFFSVLPPRFAAGAHLPATANISVLNDERHSWNDVIGWIDFGAGKVNVTDTEIEGYASGLQIGQVALNCASTPNENICGTSSFKVVNDGAGNLSGWAWSDAIGWISFSGASPAYQVVIDPATGVFSGWAWNDIVGYISFCGNGSAGSGATGGCPLSSSYKVVTSWRKMVPPGTGGGFTNNFSLISSIFDTQVSQGAAFNALLWQGTEGDGNVGFRLASSNNPSGPWVYVGPDGLETSYYEVAPDQQVGIPLIGINNHNNKRYIRYRLYLDDPVGGLSPQVDDVIISFSP